MYAYRRVSADKLREDFPDASPREMQALRLLLRHDYSQEIIKAPAQHLQGLDSAINSALGINNMSARIETITLMYMHNMELVAVALQRKMFQDFLETHPLKLMTNTNEETTSSSVSAGIVRAREEDS